MVPILRDLIDKSCVGSYQHPRKSYTKFVIGTRWVCKKTGEVGLATEYDKGVVKLTFGLLSCTKSLRDLLKNGAISPNASYIPTIFGKGFLGIGKHRTSSRSDGSSRNNHSIKYIHFKEMHRRCYEGKLGDNDHYRHWKDHEVDADFCNFQLFGDWFDFEKGCGYYQEGWHLDKDLLGTRVGINKYSPSTCCFLPPEINSALTKARKTRGKFPIGVSRCSGIDKFIARLGQKSIGVYNTPLEAFFAYKAAKEYDLKRLADKYKQCLNPKTYEALYNYEVDIND